MPAQQDSGPNLTRMTYMGRQGLKFGLIILVTLIVGRTVLNASVGFWRALNPPPPTPPTVGFGTIDPLVFPESTAPQPTSYVLETATGVLPELTDRASVLFIPPKQSSLLDDQVARRIAAEFGFVFEPTILEPTVYEFTKTEPINATFTINIDTRHFSLTTDFLNRAELALTSTPPDPLNASTGVKNLLQGAQLLPRDIATASANTRLLKANGPNVVPAVSFSEANLVEVDVRRPAINGLSVFSPYGDQGNIIAYVTSALSGVNRIIQLDYQLFTVDYSQSETYPLRSTSQAWQVLASGQGYIATWNGQDQAVIREVELGYYDPITYQSFLQPIYVFRGDDGFLGYVPAVSENWATQTSN